MTRTLQMRERAEAYAALLAKIDDIKTEMKAIEELACMAHGEVFE